MKSHETKRQYRVILLLLLSIGLVQLACNAPINRKGFPTFQVTPTFAKGTTTPGAQTGGAGTGTPGTVPSTGDGACTYAFTFISDVTVPDDTVIAPGAAFTKTWRIRNDGTCTWGPNGYGLHAVAYTSGDKLGAPDQVQLPGDVKQGQTADVSVPMVAPTTPGTYTSEWKLKIDNDPNGAGPYLGLGPNKDQPLYVRIKVGS